MYQFTATLYEQHDEYYAHGELWIVTPKGNQKLASGAFHVKGLRGSAGDETTEILAALCELCTGIAERHERSLF